MKSRPDGQGAVSSSLVEHNTNPRHLSLNEFRVLPANHPGTCMNQMPLDKNIFATNHHDDLIQPRGVYKYRNFWHIFEAPMALEGLHLPLGLARSTHLCGPLLAS